MSGSVSALTPLEQILALTPSILLRADLGVTLNSGNVSAWANQGSLGGTFSQGSASLQPAFVASAQNGQPGVGPWTASQVLTSTLDLTHPFTLAICYKQDDTSGAQRAIGSDGANWFMGMASAKYRVFSGAYASPDVSVSAGTYVQHLVTQDTGDVDTYLNGSAVGTGTTTSEVPTDITIGSSSASGQVLNGVILQIAAFSRILSAGDIASLTTITAGYFGL